MESIQPGRLIYWRNRASIVLELKGLTELVIRDMESDEVNIARAADVSLSLKADKTNQAKHLLVEDRDWDHAMARFDIIRPLVGMHGRTKEDIQKVAFQSNRSVSTVYRWLTKFEDSGLVSSLLRTPRSDKDQAKLSAEVEDIIQRNIGKNYLSAERPSVTELHRYIALDCRDADLPVPHKNTIAGRVRAIDDREQVSKRYSPNAAKQKFQPLRGSFPGADYPNAVVQIDHTPVDCIIVDEEHRQPIGRPYLTMAIDVCTKVISGFYLSLDSPSALSAGLCIAHSVFDKAQWLAKRGIDAEWPVYGKMAKIHVDNAKEFRSNMLKRACEQHGIVLEFRPKGQPNYGPHVERAFRTFMKEHHRLPGTTFSNVASKVDYDSEGKACFTLSELETWLSIFITYVYHNKAHRGINKVPPIKLFHKYVFGFDGQPGIGLPAPVQDEGTFCLDFTPYVERTIQREGVVTDNVHYFSPNLTRWIGQKDPKDRSKARKFIFARDPRDISKIYFLDPDQKIYVPIPYLDNRRPAISLWELKAAIKAIQDDPSLHVDEETIFKGIRKMRDLEAEAIERTRLAKQSRSSEKRKRRMAERRRGWEKAAVPVKETAPQDPSQDDLDIDLDSIEAFTDIEIG